MPRAIDGTRRKDRREKVLERAKGFRGRPGKLLRQAKDATAKAGVYAYRDRKRRKRDFRRLWIARISAACREQGLSYSQFMAGVIKNNIQLNRKALSNMAIEDPEAFSLIVRKVRPQL
ncbi:50S ribosomal protein L20 [Candidatus Haliotispira prima]|uniref:Large ribosomal subunit protein bL20 n=1 Tax=Candidatus Haliotispira prima TaxID=3034016 RepID=A0ABY8MH02_9SPIO|nr:50S ribosomal protein L20 [Candidatus Haliotispira prima]